MKYIVGAYATAPSTVEWSPEIESQYYRSLSDMSNVKGIEHPFINGLHNIDDEWFLQNIDPAWEFIFTTIPGVMKKLNNNNVFGIASTNKQGRLEAIEFYSKVRKAVSVLNQHLNRKAVSFVKIHTSPVAREGHSSIEPLKRSLKILSSWDWEGAKLVIEHCDAYIEGQAYEKGFMTLDDEISAILEVNAEINEKIGISINWGRSAIEARSTSGPIEHIKKASNKGLLRGIIFSGASKVEEPFGTWKDSHVPPSNSCNSKYYEDTSLLNLTEIQRSLASTKGSNLKFIGGKISIKSESLNVEERVAYNKNLLDLISLAEKQ